MLFKCCRDVVQKLDDEGDTQDDADYDYESDDSDSDTSVDLVTETEGILETGEDENEESLEGVFQGIAANLVALMCCVYMC